MNTNTQILYPAPSDRDETRLDAVEHDEARPDETIKRDNPVSVHAHIEELEQQPQSFDTKFTPNEPSRPDAVERDETRPIAPDRVATRTGATARERSSSEEPDDTALEASNWIDVEQAAELLKQRGISRTIRTIQKMCKRGDFSARLVPTENSVRYIIDDQSIEAFIERHNDKLPSGGLETAVGDVPDFYNASAHIPEAHLRPDEPERTATEVESESASHFKEVIDLKNEQITMLQSQVATANTQIAVKDEQIGAMLERDHETNVLIQNLQNLVALPEARSTQTQRTTPFDVDHLQG